jgi:hypothetical protein
MSSTTLTTRAITSFIARYNWTGSQVKIAIEFSMPHNLVGKIKGVLANCKVIPVESGDVIIGDFFNGNKSFSVKTDKIIESQSYDVKAGLDVINQDTVIIDNGTAITFTCNNGSHDLEEGTYIFKLTNDIASVFDGATIQVQEKEIYQVPNKIYNGKPDIYVETDGVNETIDNQELTFNSKASLSLINGTSNTNIQLIILKK